MYMYVLPLDNYLGLEGRKCCSVSVVYMAMRVSLLVCALTYSIFPHLQYKETII